MNRQKILKKERRISPCSTAGRGFSFEKTGRVGGESLGVIKSHFDLENGFNNAEPSKFNDPLMTLNDL